MGTVPSVVKDAFTVAQTTSPKRSVAGCVFVMGAPAMMKTGMRLQTRRRRIKRLLIRLQCFPADIKAAIAIRVVGLVPRRKIIKNARHHRQLMPSRSGSS